jgi:hypothetical protein
MRKVLLATTALATAAGVAAVANADVSIGGGVEWRYMSISDDAHQTVRASDSDFQSTQDITISMSVTTDSGLTMAQSINIGNGGVSTSVSSISGDFGTIEFNQGSGSAHAGSAYDVTSVGIAGGHGDASFILYDASTASASAVTGAASGNTGVGSLNEAVLSDAEDGALNYHSPTFGGFSFGVGVSHLDHGDDNTSMSMGAKYAGAMGDVSYTVGYATYDGTGSAADGSHVGANVSWDKVTFGIGSSANQSSNTKELKVLSYSVNYAVSDDITLNIGKVDSKENKTSTKYETTNTTIGVAYSIAPGLTFSMSSHNFDYKEAGATKNDGQALQSELKMSF